MREFKFRDNRVKVMLNGVECAAEPEAMENGLRKIGRIAERAKAGEMDAEELVAALANEIDKLFGAGSVDAIFDGVEKSAFNMADLIGFLSDAFGEHVRAFSGEEKARAEERK